MGQGKQGQREAIWGQDQIVPRFEDRGHTTRAMCGWQKVKAIKRIPPNVSRKVTTRHADIFILVQQDSHQTNNYFKLLRLKLFTAVVIANDNKANGRN